MEIIPFLPLPLAGYSDVGLARGTIEIANWLNGMEEYPLKGYNSMIIQDLVLAGSEKGKGATLYPSRISLPKRIDQPGTKTFNSEGNYRVPLTVRAIDQSREAELTAMIANELNTGFGLELLLDTIQNRDPPIEKEKVNFTDTKYLICGASHASRLADAFVATGKKVINLTKKGWRANKESCAEMALDIRQALGEATGSRIVVILQLLDNTSFYSMASEGELLVCEKENDGYYHVSGDLVVAPREVTNQTLRSVLQVVTELKGLQTVFLTPLPRYFVVPCCEREHHCASFADDGYKET